jgi:hypothetical protein
MVGRALDLSGGFQSVHSWYFGFAAMGIGSVLAASAITLTWKQTECQETSSLR